MKPPTRIHPNNHNRIRPLPIGRSGRKAVVMQCERCLVHATAQLSPRGRVNAVNVPSVNSGGVWLHKGCGGEFRAFDLKGSRDG